jgi:preprotein translocase subunit SecD
MVQISTWSKVLIILVCVLGVIYSLPNFFPKGTFGDMPEGLPGRQVNLGLDLQGGSHLLLQVDVGVVIHDRMNDEEDQVRRILRSGNYKYTGLGVSGETLHFKLTDLSKLDALRKAIRSAYSSSILTASGASATEIDVSSTDDGEFTLRMTDAGRQALVTRAVDQTIAILGIRINPQGVLEPVIQRQGKDRILLQVPGVKDPEELKRWIGKPAKMNFHLVDETHSLQQALAGRVPPTSMLLPMHDKGPNGQVEHILVQKRIRVSGDRLVDAQPGYDQNNRPDVSFRFDSVGARRFAETTRENVKRRLAIVLDNEVISAPVINEPITGGSGIITGNFTVQETNQLALLLRAGALPAPLKFLEERSVGPGLGRDSIQAGKIASMIGLALVLVYMIVSYGFFGLLADIALFFNIALILALLSVLQATLTLPGIAGIVLTMGMAVDANVLIFERMREEVRNGRTTISAIDSGYRRAMTTIVDSNLTTLIAAVLLYAFGSGPIKGFAVTLSIGIVTSMFTAVMVTRLMVVFWLRRKRPQSLPI